MKCRITEFSSGFGICLDPETMAEASLLVRMAINATKEVQTMQTAARNEQISTWIEIGKLRNGSPLVPKLKR